MEFLKFTNGEYLDALKLFRVLDKLEDEQPNEKQMKRELAIAIDALKFAMLRKENPRLRRAQLKQMQGQVVYYDATTPCFVDVANECVHCLDHDWSTWKHEWNCYQPLYRFPRIPSDINPHESRGFTIPPYDW